MNERETFLTYFGYSKEGKCHFYPLLSPDAHVDYPSQEGNLDPSLTISLQQPLQFITPTNTTTEAKTPFSGNIPLIFIFLPKYFLSKFPFFVVALVASNFYCFCDSPRSGHAKIVVIVRLYPPGCVLRADEYRLWVLL